MNEPHGISIHDTHIDRETNRKKKKMTKRKKDGKKTKVEIEIERNRDRKKMESLKEAQRER